MAQRGEEQPARLVARVRGEVQGVGFRWWVRGRLAALGLSGQAENLPDGSVEVTATGPRSALAELLALLRDGGSGRPGVVAEVREDWPGAG